MPAERGRWAWVRPGVALHEVISPDGDPDRLLTRFDCQIVKLQPKVIVGRISTPVGTLYVKRYNVFAWRIAVASLWRLSPAAGAWVGSLLGGLGVAASNMLQRQLLQARERLVCFALGSHPYRDQGRHCHRQPEPFHSFGLPAATALPVPAASFPVLEATFDPATQPIPARFGLLNRQVSQDEPGILIAFLPARKPRATHPRPKARKSSAPARSIVCLCVAPSA